MNARQRRKERRRLLALFQRGGVIKAQGWALSVVRWTYDSAASVWH